MSRFRLSQLFPPPPSHPGVRLTSFEREANAPRAFRDDRARPRARRRRPEGQPRNYASTWHAPRDAKEFLRTCLSHTGYRWREERRRALAEIAQREPRVERAKGTPQDPAFARGLWLAEVSRHGRRFNPTGNKTLPPPVPPRDAPFVVCAEEVRRYKEKFVETPPSLGSAWRAPNPIEEFAAFLIVLWSQCMTSGRLAWAARIIVEAVVLVNVADEMRGAE